MKGVLPKLVRCAQRVRKRCRLSWLTNTALIYKPKCEGRGEVAGSQPMSTAVHRSPNKLQRSISIFNLWQCSLRRYNIFSCCFGCSRRPGTKCFLLTGHCFASFVPIAQKTGQAVVPLHLSLNMWLWAEPKPMINRFYPGARFPPRPGLKKIWNF